MKLKQHFKFYLAPILSGIFIGTSYIPFPPWALFFALIPLFHFFLKIDNYKHAFIGGWITQFLLNLIGFHWIAYTASEFGHLHWSLSSLALLLFAATAHLYFPLSGVLFLFLKKKLTWGENSSFWLLPLVFLALDSIFPVIFRWHFGYPWLWVDAPGVHSAEIFGFMGLHIYTVYSNSLLLFIWKQREQNKRLMKKATGFFFASLIAINGLGYVLQKSLEPADKKINILVIQGNIGNLEKAAQQHGDQFMDYIVDTYIDLTREALEKHPETQMILWPETAFPEFLDPAYQHRSHVVKLKKLIAQSGVPLLTGGYSRNLRTRKVYNSLFLLGSQGQVLTPPYYKTHLLAFGEYLPLGEVFPSLKKLMPFVSDFGRGIGPKTLQYEHIIYGPQICYEGLFPDFSAQLAKKKAQIFINITNDSWFGFPFEPYQHLYMTLARAIEFRRPLVRSTNTGLTTVMFADGTLLPHGPRNQKWYRLFEVPFDSQPQHTLYESFAGSWPYILNICLILFVGIQFARTRTSRHRKH